MKKRLLSMSLILMLIVSIANPILAIDEKEASRKNIETDVVIHKVVVDKDKEPEMHDGKEKDVLPGKPLKGINFKYWKVDESKNADESVLRGFTTIHDIDKFREDNPGILIEEESTLKTDDQGMVRINKLKEGKYIFAELNGPEHNVVDYIGVPFLLELPQMKVDGTGYFGIDKDALHIYPKNVIHSPGLDIVKTGEDGETKISGAVFEIYKKDDSGEYKLMKAPVNGKINMGENSFATLEDLDAGEYQMIEVMPPKGYTINETPIKIKISAGKISLVDSATDMVTFYTSDEVKEKFEDFKNPRLVIKNNKAPEVEKNIEDSEEKDESSDVGDNLEWTIKTNIPTDMNLYEVFKFTDRIDSRLDFKDLESVKVFPESLKRDVDYKVNYREYKKENIDDKKEIDKGYGGIFSLEFTKEGIKNLSQLGLGKEVKITYLTSINEKAGMGEEITNNVELDFNNGQGHDTDKGDPEDPDNPINPPTDPNPPKTWTSGRRFLKVDGKNSEVLLKGAKFTLEKNDEVLKWTEDLMKINEIEENKGNFAQPIEVGKEIVMVSNDIGQFELKGIKGGTYKLREIEAPIRVDSEGKEIRYNLLREPKEVIIDKESFQEVNTINIENNYGFQIPQTGGIGTVLFTVVGLGLMLVALKMYKNKEDLEKK